MAEFPQAIEYALENECDDRSWSGKRIADVGGGFANDPDDLGGSTIYGISNAIRWREDILPPELGITDFTVPELKKVTRVAAEACYKRIYWSRYGYYVFQQDVANKIQDAAINMNWPKNSLNVTAHRLAQQACNVLGSALDVDGQLGDYSKAAINGYDPQHFLAAYVNELKAHYQAIVAANPGQAKWLKIWIPRAERTH